MLGLEGNRFENSGVNNSHKPAPEAERMHGTLSTFPHPPAESMRVTVTFVPSTETVNICLFFKAMEDGHTMPFIPVDKILELLPNEVPT